MSCILILQGGLRAIGEEEALRALEVRSRERPRRIIDLDMRPFTHDIEGGAWDLSDRFLRDQAAAIRLLADKLENAEIHYVGVAEVPQVVALGAYLGTERNIVIHEFDRDSGEWAWPAGPKRQGQIEVVGCPPSGYRVTQSGLVVVRLEISAPINDADVAEVVGGETLADVTVRFRDEVPGVAKVRSADDVEAVRMAFRGALAAVRSAFPNLEQLHLFAAVPVSAAFAIGQELVPRNSPPIQTYRYRNTPHDPPMTPAILITGTGAELAPRRLTDEQRELARALRKDTWPRAVARITGYASRQGSGTGPWFDDLEPRQLIDTVRPFPALPSIGHIVRSDSRVVDEEPAPEYRTDGYHYDVGDGSWRLTDEFVLGMNVAAGNDPVRLTELVGLFVLHEYIHSHQILTADTVAEVGKFANCLEHVDYVADLYALLHHLDLVTKENPVGLRPESAMKAFLEGQIELVIRSFWAFERPDQKVWEIRRLRRHLNWYWRHIQVHRASDLSTALRVLARKPCIELAGLRCMTRGRRVLVDLSRRDPTTALELGLVLEDESLYRRPSGPGTDLGALCAAFMSRDHDTIKRIFRAIFDHTRPGHLPH